MSEAPVETAVEDVQPKPRRTGVRHFDAIVSIAAIFISAVSLYTAIENGKTERQLVAADVWPFPRAILSNGYDAQKSTAIGVSNGGVGPAKIETFELFYRGRPVSSGRDRLRKCCGLPSDPTTANAALPHGIYVSLVDQTVLRAGESTAVMRVVPSQADPGVASRLAQLNVLLNVGFRVCYCSVLDECWVSDLRSIKTQPVRECRPPEHPYDPNGP